MAANFPTTIWDGDSLNRDSDVNTQQAPDWRDWRQVVFEVSAAQDYILNSDILLGTRIIYFGPTPEASLQYGSSIVELNLAESGTNDFRIGDGTNYVQIDSTGVMTLAGTAKRKISIHPDFDAITQIALSKPTQVTVGVYKGLSFPIYASDNEEVFYTLRVPYEWDGVSDIHLHMTVALATAEDIGDTFKFRCSWENIKDDNILSAASHDIDYEVTVLASRIVQYSVYTLHFMIDYNLHGGADDIEVGDIIGFRIRRIASSGTEVNNEIISLDMEIDFNVDKIYSTWTRP